MSRTIHNIGFRCHRNMRHMNARKSEQAALEDIMDGIVCKKRHINRLQSAMARIPNPWGDYNYVGMRS